MILCSLLSDVHLNVNSISLKVSVLLSLLTNANATVPVSVLHRDAHCSAVRVS